MFSSWLLWLRICITSFPGKGTSFPGLCLRMTLLFRKQGRFFHCFSQNLHCPTQLYFLFQQQGVSVLHQICMITTLYVHYFFLHGLTEDQCGLTKDQYGLMENHYVLTENQYCLTEALYGPQEDQCGLKENQYDLKRISMDQYGLTKDKYSTLSWHQCSTGTTITNSLDDKNLPIIMQITSMFYLYSKICTEHLVTKIGCSVADRYFGQHSNQWIWLSTQH